jgi:hypothetical protein
LIDLELPLYYRRRSSVAAAKIGAFVSGCFLDLGFWKACGCGCKRFGKVRKGWEGSGLVNVVI